MSYLLLAKRRLCRDTEVPVYRYVALVLVSPYSADKHLVK